MSDDPYQALSLSPFLQRLDRRYPDWLPGLQAEGRLREDRPPERDQLLALVSEHGLDGGLRQFRNREMMRITWREITATASLSQTFADLSILAELCLQTALDEHMRDLTGRFGTPRDEDGRAQSLVVLGLGKLGGGELNLSSDIDLILAYPAAGQCDGPRKLSNEQFFTRLARKIIASLGDVTGDGFCFRMDTRLRPFGEAGPLVCSFGALGQYYQREGRDWERYALVKARPVGGDRQAGAALLDDLAPFVYRRYIDFGAVEALRDMLDAIRSDAARKDRGDDVKRGPGGIREVEFLVQCVQLLRGGRERILRTPSLENALDALAELELLPTERLDGLRRSYAFLRRLENAIQAQHDRQTHTLPVGDERDRIARIMGVSPEVLAERLADTRLRVTAALDDSFPRRESKTDGGDAWREDLSAEAGGTWADFLGRLDRLALSGRGRQRLDRFMPLLLRQLEDRDLAGPVLEEVQGLVLAICRRSAYLALLVQNPRALERMLDLFGASDWISATVTRHPALLDELIDPALGRDLPDRADLTATAARIGGRGGDDEEGAVNALNYLKRAQSLRVAVAELEGTISPDHAERHLTELAEVLLSECLSLASDSLVRRHGRPPGKGLAIIGYGSLGGGDMSYGSDLDLVFLYPPDLAESDGERPLAPETWFTRLVRRLLALATALSPAGRLYDIDTRLRPNGRSGLLVSPLSAFEHYQMERAWVWEWQALTRARAVAGNPDLGEAFERLRRDVLGRSRKDLALRKEVRAMREKMRERGDGSTPSEAPSGQNFKQMPGGLMDIEFLAQLGVLENAPEHESLRVPASTRAQLAALGQTGWLTAEAVAILSETHQALTRARHLHALCRDGGGETPDTEEAARLCAAFGLGA